MRTTFRIICLVSVFTIDSSGAYAAPDCERLEAARERAWQQLRRSHGASQGNRLRARVRQLNEQIAAYCR